ncbi:hypothetical protein KA107_01510 [Candidatus Pacearchaeota archaeon]|nr:hypothetical protein [Candidatus Pacearchaeota archaeon]
MSKILGYIFILAGIIVAVASKLTSVSSKLTFIPKDLLVWGNYIGVGLVVIGIVIFMIFKDSSGKQEAEVPIYEGEGKNRRIVGYRKLAK